MSTKKEMIILEPAGRIHKEEFCSRPMTCPYCHGIGYFPPTKHQPWETMCPDCEGTGEVIALVTIDWKPNNTN